MSRYMVKEKKRIKSEKRWNSSQGLQDPNIKVVHSKQPEKGKGSYKPIGKYVDGMVKNQDTIREVLAGWYPEFDFTDAGVYYNDFNFMFYIHARMRRKKDNEKETEGKETKAHPDDDSVRDGGGGRPPAHGSSGEG